MNWFLFFISACTFLTCSSTYSTYQLTFPHSSNNPFARLDGTITQQLTEFTLCYWSKNTDVENYAYQFSYAVFPADYHIGVFTSKNGDAIAFTIKGLTTNYTHHQSDKWKWIHLCITWSMVENFWQIFINGEHIRSGKQNATSQPVIPNGVVTLGRGVLEDKEDSHHLYPFKGQITDLHMWNFILSSDDVGSVYNCTFGEEGNVINWNHHGWSLYNGTRISMVTVPCGRSQS